MDILKNNKKALSALCETHNVNELYFFGSVLADSICRYRIKKLFRKLHGPERKTRVPF